MKREVDNNLAVLMGEGWRVLKINGFHLAFYKIRHTIGFHYIFRYSTSRTSRIKDSNIMHFTGHICNFINGLEKG